MDSLDERIRRQNPWWAGGSAALASDPHLRSLREAAIRWEPPVLRNLSPEPGHTHTLRGPRQAGKTTSMKRWVQRLLEGGESRVLYFSFDLETEPTALYEVIRRARRLHPAPEGSWFLFLDEVTSVPDWPRGVKHAWDVGLTREDFILLTGSSAHDVRRGAERLPGRRGGGRDFLQLPMSFRDFCRVTELASVPERTLEAPRAIEAEGRKLLREANLHVEQLDRAFETFTSVGGFPAAVADFVGEGAPRAETVRLLWQAIAGDVAKGGRDQVAAAKLLEEVSVALGGPLKWKGAADAMDMKNPVTAREYAEFLAEAFALLIVFFWDTSGGTLRPQKQRKVFLMDPLLAEVPPLLMPGARRPGEAGLIEGAVAVALFRSAAAGLVQSGPVPGSVAYWRSTGGREIDFVVPTEEGRRFPVEVKGDARSRISRARSAIRQSFGRGLIATRTVYDDEVAEIPAVPVSVLLACLSETAERTAAFG